ncbi:MAG TPA: sigma-70 family RNA polymerase sigma factor [Polyangiaceae bacterium]
MTLALATPEPQKAAARPEALAESAVRERPSASELFERYLQFVWKVVAAHGVREADVPDVTQDVFMTAFRRLEDWDPNRSSATSWLYGIAARVASNHRRKAHVRREQATELPGSSVAADPGEAIDRQRLLADLGDALASIDAGKRDVFILFEVAELTMHEVAVTVGCPLKTAYKRLYAARRELTARLGAKGGAR